MNYKPYFKFLPQTFKSCFEKVVISLEVHLGQLIFALQAKSAPWAAVCRSLVYIGKKKFKLAVYITTKNSELINIYSFVQLYFVLFMCC